MGANPFLHPLKLHGIELAALGTNMAPGRGALPQTQRYPKRKVGTSATAGPLYRAGKLKFQIQRDIEKALTEPDVREKFLSFGYEPFTPTRDQFNQYIRSESVRFAGIIKKANASLD